MSTKLPSWLAHDIVTLTESAAIACHSWIGKGEEKKADAAAVKALRNRFNEIDAEGTVVIGEGERDEAPMLYIGEKVGNKKSKLKIDIAVDPLEGTTICANAKDNSLSVIAVAPAGSLLHAPDVYMEKIAVGIAVKPGLIDLDNSVEKNLKNLAKLKGCKISELTVCLLDRPRHEKIIKEIRKCGARVLLIGDGDVAGVISTSVGEYVDMYIGTGGAPEGVLAAAALKCLGGFFQGRLVFKDEKEKKRAIEQGIKQLNKKYTISDMVKSDVIFSATGVTSGWMLDGVQIFESKSKVTNSLLMHYSASNIQNIVKNYLSK